MICICPFPLHCLLHVFDVTDFYLSGNLLYLPMIFHLVDVHFKELSWRHFQCALSRQFPHTNKSCWEIFSAAQDFSVSSFTSWLLVKDSLKPTFVITLPSFLSFDVTLRHSPCLWVEIWHNIGFSKMFDAAFAVPPFMSLMDEHSAFSNKRNNSHVSIPNTHL